MSTEADVPVSSPTAKQDEADEMSAEADVSFGAPTAARDEADQ